MSKTIPLLTLAMGLAFGAWADHKWVAQAVTEGLPTAADTAIAMQPTHCPDAVALSATPDLSAFRAVIREELVAARAGAAPVISQQGDGPPSPQIVAQQRDAEARISALIGGGVWGDEQRLSFHENLQVLDNEQREKAVRQLLSAVHVGALTTDGGPPL